MEEIKCLEDVKIGDKFMCYKTLGFKTHAYMGVVTCESVTPKQCVIGGVTYRKKDAKEIGSSRWVTLYAVDEAKLAEGQLLVKRYNLQHFTEWQELSDDQITRIWAIIKEQPK